ncbi:MAG: recombination-associated protein RdgC, partial [Pseudomonadota bacterium]
MWFKNIRVYKLTRPIDLSVDTLEAALEKRQFVPCSNIDYSRIGWVPPLGPQSEQYVHPVGQYVMLCVRKQEKILPAAAINEMFEDKVQEFESTRERKMYRKEKTSLKDDIVHTLLPRALTRSARMYAYFDTAKGLLVVDAASATKAEEFLDWLRGTLG